MCGITHYKQFTKEDGLVMEQIINHTLSCLEYITYVVEDEL